MSAYFPSPLLFNSLWSAHTLRVLIHHVEKKMRVTLSLPGGRVAWHLGTTPLCSRCDSGCDAGCDTCNSALYSSCDSGCTSGCSDCPSGTYSAASTSLVRPSRAVPWPSRQASPRPSTACAPPGYQLNISVIYQRVADICFISLLSRLIRHQADNPADIALPDINPPLISCTCAFSRRERRLHLCSTRPTRTASTPCRTPAAPRGMPRALRARALCPALVLSLPSAGAQGLLARRTF